MQKGSKRLLCLLVAFSCWFFSFCLPSSAAELKEIQRRGYLTIAVKDNLRPLGFRDAQGKLQGLEIDIAERLAQEIIGKPNAAKLLPVQNRDRLALVIDNKVDIAIADITATEPRARLVSFSLPYYFDGTALITKDAAIQRLNDATRSKIAVLNGSSTIASVRYLLPQAQLVGVDSYQAARLLLANGTANVFAGDASVLAGWVQTYPQYRILPTLIGAEPLSVTMPKGLQHDELRGQVNNAIAQYVSQGWIAQRVSYWGLPDPTSRFRSGNMKKE